MWQVMVLSPNGKAEAVRFEKDGAQAFMLIARLQHTDGRTLKGPFFVHANDGKGNHQVKIVGDGPICKIANPTEEQAAILLEHFKSSATMLNEMEAEGKTANLSELELGGIVKLALGIVLKQEKLGCNVAPAAGAAGE